tara:strand:+ start:25844 stop:26239 length:396 start_codon:yes stop_codon:yes gene_type:complete
MEFSNNQQRLIYSMIQQDSESIMDFYGNDVPGYNIFLTNHQITPDKEIVINSILKDARDLNPYTNEGFKTQELQRIKKNFQKKNRELSFMQEHPPSHPMITRSSINKRTSGSKTKKKKKKNKKKKRKSYKK